mmetsp:Transcript_5649/g.18460  ORF Transcript_5649/g.18460 Transcript_5649/m.18460 type:complete len:207 (-) Transcript_5649:1242-1862(-)
MRTRRPKQPPWSRPGAVWSRPVSWPRLHLPAHTRGQGSSHMFSHVRPQLAVVEAEVDRPHSAAPAQQQELDTLDAEPQLAQRADEAEHLEKSPEEDRVARRRHVAPKVRPRVRPPKQSRGGVCAEDRVLEVRLAEVGSEDEAEGAREGEERQVGEAWRGGSCKARARGLGKGSRERGASWRDQRAGPRPPPPQTSFPTRSAARRAR